MGSIPLNLAKSVGRLRCDKTDMEPNYDQSRLIYDTLAAQAKSQEGGINWMLEESRKYTEKMLRRK